jgi:hypothetical protein
VVSSAASSNPSALAIVRRAARSTRAAQSYGITMAVNGRPLTAEQRRALIMLADAGPNGYPKAVLILHDFAPWLLEDLIRGGFPSPRKGDVACG